MKTTLDLPGTLLRRVKATAALQGRSMTALVTEALEDKLARTTKAEPAWRAVFGKATKQAVRDVDRRIADLDRIRPEDWE
jgi:hypothetical protein